MGTYNLHKGYWWLSYPELGKWLDCVDKNSKLLDLGCGSGILAAKLQEKGFRNIILSDIEDQRSHPEIMGLPFFKADLNVDKIPSENLDIIFATNLIEHLENPHHFIRECGKALKPGGKLFLTMYIGWNWISRLRFLRTGLVEGYHNHKNKSGPTAHISFLPKNILNNALSGFAPEFSFFQKRKNIKILGKKIPAIFPKSERWSAQGAFIYRKN
ncbi:hypothetical protein A3I27_02615 [Candidatus Giovannonibacteria bacterium RIFCSPLOWO2_02_FULL_43_11b]|uniref:Methyltransferase type 11 domain-containing protein n=1 Tax=Candidatus Giovannonibacteria bacterium RIFCSPHIGHO2_12_FULL_43_15 TaxID=1798341 RepID=A0A1F5WP12_9BACT|nr:MAG: hypothetical protein A2739_03365 [Candidatus Giovannonibacteria bacterium RIFCSPHIGHO2_01_FULL_43_100]OGF66301.1 MAG: hypothetical protein A3B97_01860 [Candidatus Giovannonibacteria bacterium RIFCSPHIGHO2_02_FULL_43_32]OGF77370.1 MAG: hypothetical protein A3F23_00280 [Candidatus Giovannonibacteria bacterium RIFCSPHIGHO2_12_FULL_43_15]OGF79194.1 MAG: hypothetical protein A3A15_01045 [Candidatus Giovannonibacteria bacterium RIFCSPLOWO2_01_FULL_43_60]OGF90533.1 MAG: hypothetical protein A3